MVCVYEHGRYVDKLPINILNEMLNINEELDRESYQHTFFDCYYPFYQLSITYDGRLWPCPCPVFDSGKPVFLKDMSLKEYWNSEEVLRIAHSIQHKENYFDCCLKCLSLKPAK